MRANILALVTLQTPLINCSYFSYGATVTPSLWSAFRHSHRIIEEGEGPNDGLVSVRSSRWGGDNGYKGTLVGVSHLDLINWTNRLRWLIWQLAGNKRKYEKFDWFPLNLKLIDI